VRAGNVKRLRIACKAPVAIGELSRGGLTRGEHPAWDHDLGLHEKYMPGGIVDAASGPLTLTFGSSFTTRDFLVDALEAWWAAWEETEQVAMARRQINMDNGPESSGRRTPFLHRLVAFCTAIGKPIPGLSYPPYHSKYHPIERCWGILAVHWNGTKWVDVETMVEWAKRRTWKGIHPIVALSRKGYYKGATLSKRARHAVETRRARHPELPKWDLLISPSSS